MMAKTYPSTHPKRKLPTGFETLLKSGRKIHTIRGNVDKWILVKEKLQMSKYYLSLRQWTGLPYRSVQHEILYTELRSIQTISMTYFPAFDDLCIKIDGNLFPLSRYRELANNDGMSLTDFKHYFFQEDGENCQIFNGAILHFTDLIY